MIKNSETSQTEKSSNRFPRFLREISVLSLIFLVILLIVRIVFVTPRFFQSFPVLGLILHILMLLLLIPAFYCVVKFYKFARNRILWKISRRLVLANVFIGAFPVLIVIGIFYFGTHTARIHAFNVSLREGLQQLVPNGHKLPELSSLKSVLDSDSKYLLSVYPSASIILSFKDPVSNRTITYANQRTSSGSIEGYKIPEWLNEGDFSGLVVEDSRKDATRTRLFIKSIVSSDSPTDIPFHLELSIPFDRYLLNRLKAALGQDMLLAKHSEYSDVNLVLPSAEIAPGDILESTFDSERALPATSWMWEIPLFPTSWSSGIEKRSADSDVVRVEVSIPKLWRNLFRSENVAGKKIYDALTVIVIFFLLAELVSLIIGVLLTRSITNAVHNLDRGTQFVKRGDFSHRILVKSEDQLGSLATSFNQMTEFVQQLVKERVQKERLDRELEIAKEVQERLFPNRNPQMRKLEVAGACLPARTIGGDYYDFLNLGENQLVMAIGDICGKGISAALLMANLQATLRSNVLNLHDANGWTRDNSVAEVMKRMNNQIYSYTTDNKFASVFFALYDEDRQTITCCNAGHNPPLYFKGEEIRRLSIGGTVVGIFSASQYEQETIQLSTGDLLVAYTDGIVECINEYGEEFGEHRLIQLIQNNRELSANLMSEIIMKTVLSWTFAEEQDDDMTLLISKMIK
jgi:sigma-B regulation protein RsbU (phosphoserine phosphatase)